MLKDVQATAGPLLISENVIDVVYGYDHDVTENDLEGHLM
jgi:hypothetical protein